MVSVVYGTIAPMIDKNKVYWITGASSGIGEALAETIYNAGGRVILSARNEAGLNEICRNWKDTDRFLILPLDMARHENLEEAARTACGHWQRLDVLINNAGISQRSLAVETDYDVMKTIMDVNYLGSAWLTRCVLPVMIRQKSGTIAAVSSVAGKFSTPLRSSYSASKMALQGFYDGLRGEVHHQGIHVSLIVPGFVKTDISLNALEGQGNKHGKMDPNQASGISPAKAAEMILKGLEKKKREIYMGLVFKTRLALFLGRCLPGLLSWMLRTANVT